MFLHIFVWMIKSVIIGGDGRNRRGWISQNVMCDLLFDIRFTCVFAGWEGSTSDSRILQDAVYERSYNRLKIPTGNAWFW